MDLQNRKKVDACGRPFLANPAQLMMVMLSQVCIINIIVVVS